MVLIKNYEQFEAYLGLELGVSPFHKIDQKQINQFADATLDHQWIHTDVIKQKMKVRLKQQSLMVILHFH